jgi:CRP/FNR family transcriptional regulator, cyclic AMP receptor protein
MDPDRLTKVPLFEGLSRRDLDRIARWADEVDVPEGKRLLDQGRFAYEFFVIQEGECEVRQDRRPIATLGAGDIVGEIALIERARRTATVETLSPVRAIVMSARDFGAMMDAVPAVAQRIREIEKRRIGENDLG